MGLFDKIFQSVSEDTKLTQQEAFAGIAVAIAGADGSIAVSEWDGIVNYIRRLRIYDNFSGPAFDKLFDKLFKCPAPKCLHNIAPETSYVNTFFVIFSIHNGEGGI